jgi:hypothetical protein
MFRSAAIYGSTDTVTSRVVSRQGSDWAQRTVNAAMPNQPHPQAPAWARGRLQALDELHRKGVVTDQEYAGPGPSRAATPR